MKLKSVRLVLTFDDRKKFAAFVTILITIDKRVRTHKREIKKTKPKQETRARSPSLLKEQICGPCFYLPFIYH